LKAEKAMKSLLQVFKNKQMLGEGRYHDWRNDESLTPKQKIGRSIREVKNSLNELDKTIKMNQRLKSELKVDSKDYWKTTHKALSSISERLVRLASRVGNLR
jgi:archaellum component FlaC